MRTRLLTLTLLVLAIGTSALAQQPMRANAVNDEAGAGISRFAADREYPVVAPDQTRPDATMQSTFDCWSACIYPYKCDVWGDRCVSQPVFGGCEMDPGQPPCTCSICA
jgi:hypothetical protein